MDSSRIGELVVSNPLVVKFMDEICNGEWPKKETMIGILKDAVTKGVDNMKGSGTDEGQQSGSQATRYSRAALDEDLLESIKSTAATSKKFLTWDDVAGLENAKQELQIAAVMPYKQPQLFTGKRKACQFILLYGPPGTGKTHLARVIASRTESTLYNLSASDLTNMWVGNSARLARLMFQQARDSKPAVIFFDEIDAICGRRDNSHTESHTELKSELLAQMDGAKEDNTGILFIGATNLPWHLDSAFLSRFEKKIYIPMPDHTARPRLLEIELDHTFPKELEERISVETRGYSGSDIKRLAQEALQMPLREVQSATHFVKTSDSTFYPHPSPVDDVIKMGLKKGWSSTTPGYSDSDYERIVPKMSQTPLREILNGTSHPRRSGKVYKIGWSQVEDGQMRMRDPTFADLLHAIERIKPSVDSDTLQQYEDWTRDHGLE